MDSTASNKFDESSQTVYLSFISDETLYKTIGEEVSPAKDVSIEYLDDLMLNLQTSDPNKTLEANPPGNSVSDSNTLKKLHAVESASPLRPFDKNVLNQRNGMCSTPSKEQILATINKPNGMMNMLEQIVNLTEESISHIEESNKENIQGLNDGSTLSASATSSIDVTSSTLESKMLLVSNSKEDSIPTVNIVVDEVKPTLVVSENTKRKEKLQGNASKVKRSLLPRKSFAPQRPSVVVRTTLNSPARRLTNKMIPLNVEQKLRRSIMQPMKSMTGTTSMSSRKSCMPIAQPMSAAKKSNNRLTINPITTPSINTVRSTNRIPTANKSRQTLCIAYNCEICGANFRVKSLLDAHKRSHETDTQLPAFAKKISITPTTNQANSLHGVNNQCKYCDKKFALERALHIHLMENCIKIPPSEKRKLQYTELNHVEKAQLPAFVHGHPSTPLSATSTKSSINVKTKIPMAPPTNTAISAKKSKSKVPHAGIYRTPTKSVPCHICKQSFKSILDYTNHSLTMHSISSQSKEQDALSADN